MNKELEKAKELVQADMQSRAEQAMKEIEDVVKKYNVQLIAIEGQVSIQSNI